MSRLFIINKFVIAWISSKNNVYLKSSADQTEKQISKDNLKSPDMRTTHLRVYHKSDLIVTELRRSIVTD
jgi:hypothetical protein